MSYSRNLCSRTCAAGLAVLVASMLFGSYDGSHIGAVSRSRTHTWKSIEQVRVADRVIADNPEFGAVCKSQVDPPRWRRLVLKAVAHWDDGTRDEVNIETLQTCEWITEHDAIVGETVPIPLDLLEMGLPDSLTAVVEGVYPCPDVGNAPGHLVLTTVNHLNSQVFDVTVQNATGGTQTFGVTRHHKLYANGQWRDAADLQPGEALAGFDGSVVVLSVVRRPGVQRVYNLTVEGEHVYYVSQENVLAHNNNCGWQPGDSFSNPAMGQKIHEEEFEKYLKQVWGNDFKLKMRTAKGETGIDASIVTKNKTAISRAKHAELKPMTWGGWNKFWDQLAAWRDKGLKGPVELFMYDPWGNIKSMGVFQ